MSLASARSVHRTLGILAVAAGAAVACGGDGLGGPYGGEWPGTIGSVGSGGGGIGFGKDGGPGDAGASLDGATQSDAGGPVDGGEMLAEAALPGDGGGQPGMDASTTDGGSGVGVTFNEPPGFFVSLDWVISGPSGYYSGTVYFGDAHSIEFVVGGIVAGSGYTMTLAGNDRYGDPCSGTSAPFDVVAGQITGAGLLLRCTAPGDAAEPADVTMGSVGLDAGIILVDP
jgi:hypothetical protein